MNRIGGQEFYLPALHPAEVWQESGRWSAIGVDMFRMKDRKGADMCLGMMHEEVFTTIARNEIRSYKQLPQVWYQIQIKFRAETNSGEDLIANCANCRYAAKLERATSRVTVIDDEAGSDAPEEFPTPGVRTIEDLTTFPRGAATNRQIKTLVYMMEKPTVGTL